MPIGRARELKTSETRLIFWAHKFCLVKKKNLLDLQIYSRMGKTIKKLIVNSKYYHEHQRCCDILMFIYLMASKLRYLLVDWETLNSVMTEVPII